MLSGSLGHYRIVALLGSGGMGEVYVAEDTRLGRRVALKILPEAVAASRERRERFEREARAIAALNHPNIVTIHSVEEEGGSVFLTMELVEGKTLGDTIAGKGLPLQVLLRIAIPLADAVAAAHGSGILHRDLKPANVMVSTDGRVKVLDFGLAKLQAATGAHAAESMPTADLTGEGRILGTAAYMAPEQAEAKPVDERSDLFSLGVMLYEMATGERPFKGDSTVSLLSSILRDTPRSVTELRADLPRELGRIVRRCLQKDPEQRYQTAKDLRNDLQLLKTDLDSGDIEVGVHATRSPERFASPGRWALAAGVLALIGMAAVGAWWLLPASPAARSALPFESASLKRLTTHGNAGAAAISPDGKYVAYSLREGSRESLVIRQIATAIERAVIAPDTVSYSGITFSNDGESLYYVSRKGGLTGLTNSPQQRAGALSTNATAYRISVVGGRPRRIVADVTYGISLSPDGRHLAFVREAADGSDAVVVTDADGTEERTVGTLKRPSHFGARPAWSPDGKTLAVGFCEGSGKGRLPCAVVTIPAGGGAVSELGRRWGAVEEIAWSRDGRGMLASIADQSSGWSFQIWFLSYPDGAARRVTNDANMYFTASIAPATGEVLSTQLESQSSIWTAGGSDFSRLQRISTGRSDGIAGVSAAARGTIVYATNEYDIWSMDGDGSNQKLLTTEEHNNRYPAASPDGRYVFFESWRGKGQGVWRMDADGGGATRLTTDKTWSTRPACPADGNWVLFESHGEQPMVAEMHPDGTGARPWPGKVTSLPAVSPDGKWVAGYYLQGSNRPVLNIVPREGGEPIATFARPPGATARDLRWTPDGRALTYVVQEGSVSNIWIQRVDGGEPRPLTRFTSEMIYHFDWSPDDRLVLARGPLTRDLVLLTTAR